MTATVTLTHCITEAFDGRHELRSEGVLVGRFDAVDDAKRWLNAWADQHDQSILWMSMTSATTYATRTGQ